MIGIKQGIDQLTSSNITEKYLPYNPLSTYTVEKLDALTSSSVVLWNNYYFRCLGTNVTISPEESTTLWEEFEVSNREACLDLQSNTKTTISGENIVMEFKKNQMECLVLGKFEASGIIVEYLDALGDVIPAFTITQYYSVNEEVESYYDMLNEPYSLEVNRDIFIRLVAVGDKIRVTILQTFESKAAIGFLYGGREVFLGNTLLPLPLGTESSKVVVTKPSGRTVIKSITSRTTYDFSTSIPSLLTMKTKSKINEFRYQTMVFVLDENDNSAYNNLVILGEIQIGRPEITHSEEHDITWSIIESI